MKKDTCATVTVVKAQPVGSRTDRQCPKVRVP
jgi:hypothetical protein